MLINRIDIPFFLSFLTLLLFPNSRLLFFAPVLILSYYQRSLLVCLWISFISGLFIDLFSSYDHLGLTAFNYCLCCTVLYPQKQHFFADRMSTLPIMTLLFSIVSSLIHFILFEFLERPLTVSLNWAASDLIIMPLFDSIYAFLLFVLPSYLIGLRPKKAKDYFL